MKKLTFFISFLISFNTLALDFNFSEKNEDGNRIIKISGGISNNQKYPPLELKNGDRIFITSPGGVPDQIHNLKKYFDKEIQPGVVPKVIMREWCASTCILLLTMLNNMSHEGKIELILDNKLRLGFHGCYNPSSVEISLACNNGMLRFMIGQGLSESWLDINMNLFLRPTKEYLIVKRAKDPSLQGGGLLDHARLEDNTENYLVFPVRVSESGSSTDLEPSTEG